MCTTKRAALLAVTVSLMWVAAASAQGSAVLYGAANGLDEGFAPSTLYTIDLATGVATPVGLIQVPGLGEGEAVTNVTGLAFLDDGTLVGSARADDLASCGGSCAALVGIDSATGAATLIGLMGDDAVEGQCGRVTDLTYDPTTRTLYGNAARCPVTNELSTINPATGARSVVGETGLDASGNGLAREPATGTLFATPFDDLVTLNPTTGVATVVPGSAASPEVISALAFHPLTGVLYGAAIFDASLVTVNTATGVTTVHTEVTAGGEPLFGLDAIAFQGPGGCPDAPLGPCADAQTASLKLKAKGGQLKLDLKKLGATTKSEFGTPTSDTGYAVCLYDSDGGNPTLSAGYTVPFGSDWKEQKKGFTFKDKEGDPHGITSAKLKEGEEGKAKVSVKGKGVDLPDLPLSSDSAVGQVVNDLGSCFGATVNATKENQNTAEKYTGSKKTTPTPTPTATPTATATPTPTPTATATPTAELTSL
jgi:hypothetical protein